MYGIEAPTGINIQVQQTVYPAPVYPQPVYPPPVYPQQPIYPTSSTIYQQPIVPPLVY